MRRARVVITGAAYRCRFHFLLTAWGETTWVEQTLLGWGACALADNAVLTASLLNEAVPGVCRPDETIQVRTADSDLAVSALCGLQPWRMQLSLPYVTSPVQLGTG